MTFDLDGFVNEVSDQLKAEQDAQRGPASSRKIFGRELKREVQDHKAKDLQEKKAPLRYEDDRGPSRIVLAPGVRRPDPDSRQ